MKQLNDKVALITGAGSGIGRETALALAREGCAVVVNDMLPARAAETVAEIRRLGGRATPIAADVSTFDAVTALVAGAREAHGQVDILVNNAGRVMGGAVGHIPLEEWEQMMRVNFWSHVYATHLLLPQMLERGSGHLVYLSSISGIATSPYAVAYGSSKFAVTALAEAVKAQAWQRGVGVTLVCPAMTKTHIAGDSRFFMRSEALSTDVQRYFGNEIVRGIDPARVARKIVRAIQRDRFLVTTHWYIRPLMVFRALFPSLYPLLSGWIGKRTVAGLKTGHDEVDLPPDPTKDLLKTTK